MSTFAKTCYLFKKQTQKTKKDKTDQKDGHALYSLINNGGKPTSLSTKVHPDNIYLRTHEINKSLHQHWSSAVILFVMARWAEDEEASYRASGRR